MTEASSHAVYSRAAAQMLASFSDLVEAQVKAAQSNEFKMIDDVFTPLDMDNALDDDDDIDVTQTKDEWTRLAKNFRQVAEYLNGYADCIDADADQQVAA